MAAHRIYTIPMRRHRGALYIVFIIQFLCFYLCLDDRECSTDVPMFQCSYSAIVAVDSLPSSRALSHFETVVGISQTRDFLISKRQQRHYLKIDHVNTVSSRTDSCAAPTDSDRSEGILHPRDYVR